MRNLLVLMKLSGLRVSSMGQYNQEIEYDQKYLLQLWATYVMYQQSLETKQETINIEILNKNNLKNKEEKKELGLLFYKKLKIIKKKKKKNLSLVLFSILKRLSIIICLTGCEADISNKILS